MLFPELRQLIDKRKIELLACRAIINFQKRIKIM